MEARIATPAEVEELRLPKIAPGMERVVFVLVVEDVVRGHLCLSRGLGEVFGHDTEIDAECRHGHAAVMLWLRARDQARAWGATSVNIHFSKDDGHMIDFWEKQGFTAQFVVYRGDI